MSTVDVGDKIKGLSQNYYTVVANGSVIYLAVHISLQSVNVHVYEHLNLSKDQKKVLQVLGFTLQKEYWSLRIYKNDHLYSTDIIVGGIVFALRHVNPWITEYPTLSSY